MVNVYGQNGDMGWLLSWGDERAAAKCELPPVMHARNRSLLIRGLSIDSRAYVISLHARLPIRTLRPACANQEAWVVIRANYNHTAAGHAWTRKLPRNIVPKAVFSLIHFPASLIRHWSSCHSGGCSLNKPIPSKCSVKNAIIWGGRDMPLSTFFPT